MTMVTATETRTAQELHDYLFDDPLANPNNQPTYLAEPEILQRYGERAIEVLKRHDAEVRPLARKLALETKNAEPYERNLKVVIGETPTEYGYKLEFAKRGKFILPVIKKVPIGKVFGHYRPDTDTLTIHYGVFPEFAGDDPDRSMLQDMGIEYELPKGVLTHERAHRIQHENGALDKYHWREMVEGLATLATEYLLNKPQKVYKDIQPYARKLIEKVGFRRAFRGDVDDNDRRPPVGFIPMAA